MISDLEFDSFDSEVDQLFRDAKAEAKERGHDFDVPNEERVERIVEQARFEAAVKDTTTFLFRSFAPAIAELMVGVLRALIERELRSGDEDNGQSPDARADSDRSQSPTDPNGSRL